MLLKYYGIGVDFNNFTVWTCNQCETIFLGSADQALLSQDDTTFYGHAKLAYFFLVRVALKPHACLFSFCR